MAHSAHSGRRASQRPSLTVAAAAPSGTGLSAQFFGTLPFQTPFSAVPEAPIAPEYIDDLRKVVDHRTELRTMLEEVATVLSNERTPTPMYQQMVHLGEVAEGPAGPSSRRSSAVVSPVQSSVSVEGGGSSCGTQHLSAPGGGSSQLAPSEAKKMLLPSPTSPFLSATGAAGLRSPGSSPLSSPKDGSVSTPRTEKVEEGVPVALGRRASRQTPSSVSPRQASLAPVEQAPMHYCMRWSGVTPISEKVAGYWTMPVHSRRQVKNSITALRAIVAMQHPSIGVLECAYVATPNAAFFIVKDTAVPPQCAESLLFSSPEATMTTHMLAMELNLLFHAEQRPVVKYLNTTISPASGSPKSNNSSPSSPTGAAGKAARFEDPQLPPLMLFDASELMPPLFPSYIVPYHTFVSSRMRPEFVRDYAIPLVSTALYRDCPLGSQNQHKVNLLKATLFLVNIVVPKVARILDGEPFPLYGDGLCKRLHMFGVNLRFLGWLLPWMENAEAIRGVLTEIIARSYKHIEGEDEEKETSWEMLSRIAVKHFFPPHLQVPLPTFHQSSALFLSRLHPRYGLDTDTLELYNVKDVGIMDVDLEVSLHMQSVPPTPDYAMGFEYETLILPHMIDSEQLGERVEQLCRYRHRVVPLPGKWANLTREIVFQSGSHVANHYFLHLQDALLARSDVHGTLHPRQFPLLKGLATGSHVLYPFEQDVKTDQSAMLYALHARNVLDPSSFATSVDPVFDADCGIPPLRDCDVGDMRTLPEILIAALHLSCSRPREASEVATEAMQHVHDHRLILGLLTFLLQLVETQQMTAVHAAREKQRQASMTTVSSSGELAALGGSAALSGSQLSDVSHTDIDTEETLELLHHQAAVVQKAFPPKHHFRVEVMEHLRVATETARKQAAASSPTVPHVESFRGSFSGSLKKQKGGSSVNLDRVASQRGTMLSFVSQGVGSSVKRMLFSFLHPILGVHEDAIYVPPQCTRSPTSVVPVGSHRMAVSEVVSYFLNLHKNTDHTANITRAKSIDHSLLSFYESLPQKKCLVLLGESSKTTIIADIAAKMQAGVPIAPGGTPCDYVPVYIDVPKHTPMEETFIKRALAPLTDSQIAHLKKNPKVLLILDSIGEGPRKYSAIADPEIGILSWAGKVIMTSKFRLLQNFPPIQRYHTIFPPDQEYSKHFGPQDVEVCDVHPFSYKEITAMTERFVLHHRQLGEREKYLHALTHTIPHFLRLLVEPFFLVQSLAVLRGVIDSDTQTGWKRVVDVVDAVVWRWVQAKEPDPLQRHRALLYAIGLAERMTMEGKADLVNPQAAEYEHCLPLRYVESTEKVYFLNSIFRTYFLALKITLEMSSDSSPGHPQFGTHVGRSMFPQLMDDLKRDAHRMTQQHLTTLAIKGFSSDMAQAATFSAIEKLRRGLRRELTGGEWLVRNHVCNSTDSNLLPLLADRALSCQSFREALWTALKSQRKYSTLTSNAATILCHAGFSFAGESLRDVNFFQANVSGGRFIATDLRSSSWRYAVAKKVDFSFAETHGADWKNIAIGAQLRVAHSSTVALLCVTCSPNSADIVVTGDESGKVVLWDHEGGETIHTVEHGSPVGCVDFNPIGTLFLSASIGTDALIKVWSCDSLPAIAPKVRAVLSGHQGRITAAKFTADGTIASTSMDWTVKLWSVKDLLILERAGAGGAGSGHQASPQRRGAVGTLDSSRNTGPARFRHLTGGGAGGGGGGGAVGARTPSPVQMAGRNSPKRAPRHLPPLLGSSPTATGRSPSPGRSLGVKAAARVECGRGVKNPDRIMKLSPMTTLAAGEDMITAFAVCPPTADNNHEVNIFATLNSVGLVTVGSLTTGKTIKAFTAASTKGANCIALSPNGTKLAVPQPRGINLYNPFSGDLISTLGFEGPSDISSAVTFSTDGLLVAAAQDHWLVVWEVAAGSTVMRKEAHHNRISGLTFTPVGNNIVSASWDGSMKTWPLQLVAAVEVEKPEPTEYRFLYIGNKGRHIVAVGAGGRVEVFDVGTGARLGTAFEAPFDPVVGAVETEGEIAAVGLTNIHVFNIFKKTPPLVLSAHSKAVSSLTFLSPNFVSSSPSGHLQGGFRSFGGAGGLRKMSVGSMGAIKRAPQFLGHHGSVSSHSQQQASEQEIARQQAVCSHCLSILVSVSLDRSYRVWDANTGALLIRQTNDAPLHSLSLGKTRMYLVSGFLSTKQLSVDMIKPVLHEGGNSGLFNRPLGGGAPVLEGGSPAATPAKGGGELNPSPTGALRRRRSSLAFLSNSLTGGAPPPPGSPESRSMSITSPSATSFGSYDPLSPGADTATVGSLRSMRLAMLALKKVYSVPFDTSHRYVLPFLRQTVKTSTTATIGPIKVNVKEGTVRSAVSADESHIVVSVEKYVYVWNVVKKVHVRATETHSALITAIDVQPQRSGQDVAKSLVVTSSVDGVVRLAHLVSGECLVTIRPPLSRPINGVGFSDEHSIVTGGTDMILRRWNVQGASCLVGNKSTFATMDWWELRDWLGTKGLDGLRDSLEGFTGGDIIGFTPAEFKKVLGADDPSLVTKLQRQLAEIRQEGYEVGETTAFDDGTITRNAFAQYTPEKVIEWLEAERFTALATLVYTAKTTGEVLQRSTVDEILKIGNVDYENVVAMMHEEMAFVRSKMKESFLQKSVEDVAQSAKQKHQFLQFGLVVSELNGIQLLEKTNFSYRMSWYCPDCEKTVADTSSICPVSNRDHMDVEQQHDAETRNHVTHLATLLKDNHYAMVHRLEKRLGAMPEGVFRHGMHWYEMAEEEGHLGAAVFALNELAPYTNLNIMSAKLTIYSTGRETHSMVAVTEHNATDVNGNPIHHHHHQHPRRESLNISTTEAKVGSSSTGSPGTKPSTSVVAFSGSRLLSALSSVDLGMARYHEHGTEAPLPAGWKRNMPTKETPSGSYQSGTYLQHTHPSMPRAAALSQGGTTSTLATLAEPYEGPTMVPAPPQDCHVFRISETEREKSGRIIYYADVTQQLQHLIESRQKQFTFLVAADFARVTSNTVFFAAQTPKLTVRYFHSDRLCGCETPVLGEHSMCDRYCNVGSRCTGHQCVSRTEACRRSPFLIWDALPAKDASFTQVKGEYLRNLSSINGRFIAEKQAAEEESRQQQRTATGGGGVASPVVETLAEMLPLGTNQTKTTSRLQGARRSVTSLGGGSGTGGGESGTVSASTTSIQAPTSTGTGGGKHTPPPKALGARGGRASG